jgi:hypothetical protein
MGGQRFAGGGDAGGRVEHGKTPARVAAAWASIAAAWSGRFAGPVRHGILPALVPVVTRRRPPLRRGLSGLAPAWPAVPLWEGSIRR